jgi:hypothetical protein
MEIYPRQRLGQIWEIPPQGNRKLPFYEYLYKVCLTDKIAL